jgi:hypothetical protein
MTWFWLPLVVVLWLIVLWFHVIVLGLLMFVPQQVHAAERRWPRLVRGIERGQTIVVGLMLLGSSIALTVLALWTMLGRTTR